MRLVSTDQKRAGSWNAIGTPVVFQNVADELVEKFTWLKELCHMWSIPIKSAGLYFSFYLFVCIVFSVMRSEFLSRGQ